MSLATFRSVLVSEMGSLGSATADTRSRSLVADRIRHFRIMGCLSPTANGVGGAEQMRHAAGRIPAGGARHATLAPASGPALGTLPQHGHSERSTAQPGIRLTTGRGQKLDQHDPALGLHGTTRLGPVGAPRTPPPHTPLRPGQPASGFLVM